MRFAADKVLQAGNSKVLLTERGNSFGYDDLIVDFRNIGSLKEIGQPVIFDATHSVQRPNAGGVTGGTPQHISSLLLASIAAGADGLFVETHPDPSQALSDGSNMIALSELTALMDIIGPSKVDMP